MKEDQIAIIQKENLVEWNIRNGIDFDGMKHKVMLLGTSSKDFGCKMGLHRLETMEEK